MAHETHFTDGTEITFNSAELCTTGFTERDQLYAWSYLVGTGLCYKLGGWFEMIARDMIESGKLDEDGTILDD